MRSAHPALQIVQAGSHAFEAGRLALGCGGGIGGLALVFLLLLLTRGAFFACVKPFLYPIGRFALRKGGLLLDAEQEQGQGMLAGKFPARAGALEDRPGQVGFDLVGFGAAAFAFAPYGVFVEAERRPLAGFEQSLRRLDGGGVRGEGQYRFGGEFHRLSCCRRPCGRFLKDRKKGGRRDGAGGTPLPLRGRPCSGARPASQAFLREHPTVLEAFCHNEGFPATRNPFFSGRCPQKEPFPQEDGKKALLLGRPPFGRGNNTVVPTGRFPLRGKRDGSVPPQEPRQHSGHEPEHGNEGKGMAEARRVGDETDDRRAEQEAEEPDG